MSLAATLVPLALLQAASGFVLPEEDTITDGKSKALDRVTTDAVNDAIRYYNIHNRHSALIALPDIEGGHNGTDVKYSYAATGGKMISKGVKLAEDVHGVKLIEMFIPSPETRTYILTANISITIKGLELVYDTVEIHYDGKAHPTEKPRIARRPHGNPTGAAKAKVDNEFVIEMKMAHKYSRQEDVQCANTVSKITVGAFDVKRIWVDPELGPIVRELANDFKAQLVKDTNAIHIIEKLIKRRSSLDQDCIYMTPREFQEFTKVPKL